MSALSMVAELRTPRETTSLARGEIGAKFAWRPRVSICAGVRRRRTREFKYVSFACFTDAVRGKNSFYDMQLDVDTWPVTA